MPKRWMKLDRLRTVVAPRLKPLQRAVQVFGFHLATLDLRRHRDRYAALFAGISVLLWILSGWLLALFGITVLAGFGFGHALLMLALLFVSAWLVIGDAACSREAIRKALFSAREEV